MSAISGDCNRLAGVAFWTTVVIVVSAAYALSMPIALTLSDLPWVPRWIRATVVTVYGPLVNFLLWMSGDTL